MNAGPYVINTLLPCPYVSAAVSVGRERLATFAGAVGAPVGLENLPGALSPADATSQADFLDDILKPSDSFLLLDIHNVFAQAVNLGLDPFALLATFPGDRVRIIHVSGGRWVDVEGKPYRFDGHDGAVPTEVYPLLRAALAHCPRTEMVSFERRGNSLDTRAEVAQMQADYRYLFEIVKTGTANEAPQARPLAAEPLVDKDALLRFEDLAAYEDALVEELSVSASPQTLIANLLMHPEVSAVRDYVASFRPRNLAATSHLVRRWARTEEEMASSGLLAKRA